MWRMVNLCQHVVTLARLSTARRISCRNAAINIVVCRAVLQQVAAADGHQPLLSHFLLTPVTVSSHKNINAPKLKFDELVVKGEQAHQRFRGTDRAITCCAVTLIPSNSNDTASATDSAEASEFSIDCRTRIAT